MAVIKKVKVLFSNVINVDDFSQKYQIVTQLTEEQAADAEAAGINVKTKEYDGTTQFLATFKSKFRPQVVGLDGKTEFPLEGEIGRGSVISVQYKLRNWTQPGKTGVSADLNKIQMITLEGGSASEFDEEDGDFGAEDQY